MRPILIALTLVSSLLSSPAHRSVLLERLGNAFSWSGSPSSEKEGCILDPSGLHPAGGLGTGEAGCILDPNGLCASAAPTPGEEGCILDPNGRCVR